MKLSDSISIKPSLNDNQRIKGEYKIDNFEKIVRLIQKDHLNAIYTVSDDEVIKGMKLIWERMKIIIEPSCATPVAVVMSSKFKQLENIEKVGIILTGGNVDLAKLPF